MNLLMLFLLSLFVGGQIAWAGGELDGHSTFLHYNVAGKTKEIDLRLFVGFGDNAVKSMADSVTKTIYLVRNGWDTTGIFAIPQGIDGKWDPSKASFVMDFGRRSYWASLYNSLDHNFYVQTDVENNENLNIWRLNPRSKTLTQITHSAYLGSYALSPNGNSLYYAGRDKIAGWNASPCVQKININGSGEENLYCTKPGVDQQIFLYEPPRANQKESVVAFVVSPGSSYNLLNLGIYDTVSKKFEVVSDTKYTRLRLSPLGWRGDDLYLINSENHSNPKNNGSQSLYKFNLQTKKFTLLLKNEVDAMEVADFDPQSGQILLKESGFKKSKFKKSPTKVNRILVYDTNAEKVTASYGSLDFDVTDYYTQVLGNGQFLFSANKGDNFALDVVDTSQRGASAFHTVVSINQQLAQACDTEVLNFDTFDTPTYHDNSTHQIQGIVFKPAVELPDKVPAAGVIFAHGGPQMQLKKDDWNSTIQLLCHMGYYVFGVNPRGSTGFDSTWPGFSTLVNNHWGEGDFKDYIYGRKFLAKKYNIPLERIGITGESYGGYMSDWAITQHDKSDPQNDFPWAIPFYGAPDLLGMLTTTDVPFVLVTGMGDPATNKDSYISHSPITFAADVTNPILLIHGQNDHRIPIEGTRKFYAKLVSVGKKDLVTLVETRGDGHEFSYMNTELQAYQAVLDFLAKVAPLER